MNTQLDPYGVSDALRRLADNLTSDVTSLTVNDIADALVDAAEFIVDFADEHYSYITKTRVVLNVGHETIDLTEQVVSMISASFVEDFVKQAVAAHIGKA